jgi:hypothetical protein
MTAYDEATNNLGKPAYAGGTINTNTNTDGIEIDTQNYEALTFYVYTGTVTDGTYTLQVLESDTSGSGYTKADDDFVINSGEAFAAADDNTVKQIGYVGNKRYAKLRIVSASTSTGAVFKGAIAVKGKPAHKPTV